MTRRTSLAAIALPLVFPSFAFADEHLKNYGIIRDYINDFATRFLSEMRNGQDRLEDSIQENGFETIQKVHAQRDLSALDYAETKVRKKTALADDEKRFKEIAYDFLQGIHKYSNGIPVNYFDSPVQDGYTDWVRLRTSLFERLLSANKDAKDFPGLTRNTLTRGQYRKYLDEQIDIINRVYDALQQSRKGWKGYFAEGGIDSARNFTAVFFEKTMEEIYPKK